MKTKIAKIELTFTESPRFKCPKTFGSMTVADSFVFRENWEALRRDKGEDVRYYKTDFTVTFEDGQTYQGRYDIGADHPNLSSHIINFCQVYSGRKKPAHFKSEDWEDFRRNFCNEKWGEWLDKYDFSTEVA